MSGMENPDHWKQVGHEIFPGGIPVPVPTWNGFLEQIVEFERGLQTEPNTRELAEISGTAEGLK